MGELNIEKVDEAKFVPPDKGLEVGYYGYTPDDTDNAEYTVAGQVGATAKVTDTPKSASKGASK
jgi:hypothetical protein